MRSGSEDLEQGWGCPQVTEVSWSYCYCVWMIYLSSSLHLPLSPPFLHSFLLPIFPASLPPSFFYSLPPSFLSSFLPSLFPSSHPPSSFSFFLSLFTSLSPSPSSLSVNSDAQSCYLLFSDHRSPVLSFYFSCHSWSLDQPCSLKVTY